jgi:type I restriction enzyme R subunit
MTRELTELLRKNRTIDWQRKESARANMRRLIKRLLKKYKYPPEGQEDALKTVISQCEMWTDNMELDEVGEKHVDNQVYFAPGDDAQEYGQVAEDSPNDYKV